MSSHGNSNLDRASAWWAGLIREVLAFLIGAVLIVWQGLFEKQPQTVIVMAGCALVGVPLAGILNRAIAPKGKDD